VCAERDKDGHGTICDTNRESFEPAAPLSEDKGEESQDVLHNLTHAFVRVAAGRIDGRFVVIAVPVLVALWHALSLIRLIILQH
jgi:hypothetical protein